MTKRIRLLLISVSCLLALYIVIGGVLGKSDSSSDKTYRDLGVYSEVLSRIKSDYVTEPDLKKVTTGAIHGFLEALDPFSTYLTPEQYQEYLKHPGPEPDTAGIFLSKRMGFGTVISVLPGSPAEKAGIRAGDLIDSVDNVATRELSVVQVERMLNNGPPGSTVTVAVVRESRGEPQKVTLTRAPVSYPPVITKTVQQSTGYLRVATFNKGKSAELADQLRQLMAQGATKIVLDLRNCAGGDVEEAIGTASLFLDKGLVGYLVGQRFPRQDLDVAPSRQICKLPVAVLINQSTAGPAELVAAAILDNKRGEAVGVRSFGVGLYQKPVPIGDGSAVLLSVAKYYGPDGKAIQDNGITPSVVEATGDTESASADESGAEEPEHFGDKDDNQLNKAIEILSNLSEHAKAA